MFTHNSKRTVSVLALLLGTLGGATTASAQGSDAKLEADATPRTSAFERKLTAMTGKTGGLTSKQVAARTLADSPDVAAKQADVARAAGDVDRAIAAYFPKLSLQGKYTRLNSIDDGVLGPFVVAPGVESGQPVPAGSTLAVQSMAIESIDNQWSFQASLTAPLSDYPLRLVDAHKSAEHSAKASELDLRATTRKAGYDARVLYYNWVKAELAVVVAEQSLELAKQQRDRVEAFAGAGSATAADQAQMKALVANSELLLIKSKNLASLQRTQLAITMHQKGEALAADYEIGEDFGVAPQVPAGLESPSSLASSALGARPELGAVDEQVSSLRAYASATRSKAWPRLDAFATIGAVNPDQRAFPATAEFHKSWQVGLTLTYSPNDTVDGVLAASQVERQADAAEAKRVSLSDSIRLEVADSLRGYRDAEASVTSTAASSASAEEAYRARRELFLANNATSVELTEAHGDLLRARLDSVSAIVGLRMAALRLEYAVGRDAI